MRSAKTRTTSQATAAHKAFLSVSRDLCVLQNQHSQALDKQANEDLSWLAQAMRKAATEHIG